MIAMLRLAPEPPREMLALGTSVGFEEDADTTNAEAAVSESLTVKPSAAVSVFSTITMSLMVEIVGEELTVEKAKRKISAPVSEMEAVGKFTPATKTREAESLESLEASTKPVEMAEKFLISTNRLPAAGS